MAEKGRHGMRKWAKKGMGWREKRMETERKGKIRKGMGS